jgi:hypothetical protein
MYEWINYPHAIELFASSELKKRIRDHMRIFCN